MNFYIAAIIILSLVLIALTVIFFVVLLTRGRDSSPSSYGQQGLMTGAEYGVYGVSADGSFGAPAGGSSGELRASVYLDETANGNRFRADLGDGSVIGRLVVGNPTLNDLSVSPSPYLSRQHARLFSEGGAVFIENMSKYGTTLNGRELVGPAQIYRGDVIVMGDVELRVAGIDYYG